MTDPQAVRPYSGFRATAIAGVAAGVLYGLLFRWAFDKPAMKEVFSLVSTGFLVAVPFALGFLTVYIGESRGRISWWARILLPWAASMLALGASLFLAWEGLVCIALWVPLFLLEATVGALFAVLARWLLRRRRARRGAVLSVACLPLLVGAVEHQLPVPQDFRRVETTIDIAATPARIWPEIASVRAFAPGELPRSWSHRIGFPLPVAATLSRPGVGGIRRATFEGGVVFTETVTAWEPGRRLAFSIHADPTSIPMRTLDEHVTVGGPYFDVLAGEYRIEPLGPGRVRLHLASRHRVSTHINLYARWWTDFILGDVQRTILAAIKDRAETATSTWRSLPAPP